MCGCLSIWAAPYGLLINGTIEIKATALSDQDYSGRDQFLASCVALAQGDRVQICDFGNNNATWMCAVDPYGEYQKFTKNADYLICNAAGSYDFYIKLKYQDDVLYIGASQNCGGTTPNPTYFITGDENLLGEDKWTPNAIELAKDESTNVFAYTFSQLETDAIYRLKITNGTWEQSWGYASVQNPHPGIIHDSDDNIVFEMRTTGDVVITFNGESITLTGDFTDTPSINNTYSSSVPTSCPDVMLQGFYWDSNQDKYYGNTRWTTLQEQSKEIASFFDLIWLPPSSLSTGGVGYIPKQYSNQNSDWGSRAELEQLIKMFHKGGAKVIADMVINHIDGKDGWCSFYEQDFGEYGRFQVDPSYICKEDEMSSDPAASDCRPTGPNDDGYAGESNYHAGRDFAHDSEHVREMFRAYAKWIIHEMKYDGFRYDYCKGFHMSHVNDYNYNSGAYFSVLEYYDGNRDVLWSRIAEAWENTLAFDFGMKFNVLNDGIAQFNYAKCKAPNCLIGMGKGKWAVNFIDNHDTFERGNGCDFGGDSMSEDMKDRLLQANAFILSMPGVPCIFYPHWVKYKEKLKAMILARKAAGVHSESVVSDEAASDGTGYRAYVQGTKGTLILELGGWVSDSHWGYSEVVAGPGYKMFITYDVAVPELTVYTKSTTYSTPTLSIDMGAVGIGGTPTIYYTLDGSDPSSSTTSRKIYNDMLTISGTVTLKACAELNGKTSEVQTYVYTYEPGIATSIDKQCQPKLDFSQPMFNIYGQKVDINYKGIVIQDGSKFIN